MRYRALATDYDGTLAERGAVADSTWAAVERLRSTGRRVVLVTGRELDELREVCPRLDLFDRVVAENGALLYRPEDRTEEALGPRPPDAFLEALMARGVGPISSGRVIVATWEPHRPVIEETIRELGLDLVVIPNKRALMVLPPGIDKASGLARALGELGLTPLDTVGVGDAENDSAMLEACGVGVAVANALPMLKARADLVTEGERGSGVVELIGRMIDEALPAR
ncbi:HAD family hydrolase [Tundrisphaera lichenicola]|uniref:HAD family hydrolase n=1 Tax=Tundrisphaera lichenicola TaxID=2029860 RepID=UPI003EBF9ED8